MAVQYQVNLSTKYLPQDAEFTMGFSDILPIQQLVKKMASASIDKESVTYDLVLEKDYDDVLRMLKNTFFKDEPLNKSLQLGECEELTDYCMKYLSENCSFKATNPDGEVIGVIINGIAKKPDPNEILENFSSKCKHEKFSKIMAFMDFLDTKYNVFDLYPEIESFIDGKILSVDPRYRGFGMAGKLTDKTMEYMREQNLNVFHVLCTSHYSARVLEKLDFNEIFSFPFSEFVVDGKQVLKPEEPHVAARIFTKEI